MAQNDTLHAAERLAVALRLYIEGAEINDQGFVQAALKEGDAALAMVQSQPYHVKRLFERVRGTMLVEANELFGDLDRSRK